MALQSSFTWSLLRSAPSISCTILSISSKVMIPLRSLSKALKDSQSTGMDVVCFWSNEAEMNSCTFTEPEPSRSIFSKSVSSSRSFSDMFKCFFRPLTTSSTVSTPSPFLSRQRKACSTVSATWPSRGNCSAMTRKTKRLNWHSSTFLWTLLNSFTMRFLGKDTLASFTQGCLRSVLAEIRILGFSFSMLSTTSLAWSDNLLHIAVWNLTSCVFTAPTIPARLVAE
mmetsp:Transcript_134538/g.287850  ORF Transcript_134538/g.287850 Transcript_134538/m.287850 type:complete len:226 (+) Transcript_134538:360-1037(+)